MNRLAFLVTAVAMVAAHSGCGGNDNDENWFPGGGNGGSDDDAGGSGGTGGTAGTGGAAGTGGTGGAHDAGPGDSAADAVAPVAPDQPAKHSVRVLVIEQNPFLVSKGAKASEFLGQDYQAAIQELVDDLEQSSHGLLDCTIVDSEHLNEFPRYKSPIQLKNGTTAYSMDEETWLDVFGAGWYGWWDNPSCKQIAPYSYDYEYLLSKFDLVTRKNNDAFDQVWLVTIDPANDYESRMVGSSAYWINGPPIKKQSGNFPVMNVSISRRDANFECFGHAAESIMDVVFDSTFDHYAANSLVVTDIDKLSLWDRFVLNQHATPGFASVGNVHFAPNSVEDYDWQNTSTVMSSWRDWLDYPNLTGETQKSTGKDWVPHTNSLFSAARMHHRWWFGLMPHVGGRTVHGYSNSWWDYLTTLDYAVNLTAAESTSRSCKAGDYVGDLPFQVTFHSGAEKLHTVSVIPENRLDVRSSNTNVVSIQNNRLRAVAPGKSHVSLSVDGNEAGYDITVE